MKRYILIVTFLILSNIRGAEISQNIGPVNLTKIITNLKLETLSNEIKNITPERLNKIKYELENRGMSQFIKDVDMIFARIKFLEDLITKLKTIQQYTDVRKEASDLDRGVKSIIDVVTWLEHQRSTIPGNSLSFSLSEERHMKDVFDHSSKIFEADYKKIELLNEYLEYIDKLKTNITLSLQKQGIIKDVRKGIYKIIKLPTYTEWLKGKRTKEISESSTYGTVQAELKQLFGEK